MIRTIRDGATWRLQTPVLYLRQPASGRRVTLMAMIHIGMPEYYTRLGELVHEHEGLVLFEGVGELTPEEIAALTDEERQVYASLASLQQAYRRIAASLHLVAQPDAMPKPAPDWVRADLPARELLRRWVATRAPIIPVMDAAGRALDSALTRRVTRLLLLQEPFILGAFQFMRGRTPGLSRLTRLLIDDRNAAALTVFDGTSSERNVLLMYGAGHVPGLLAGFAARGYEVTARDWFTAHAEPIPFAGLFQRAAERWRAGRGGYQPGQSKGPTVL